MINPIQDLNTIINTITEAGVHVFVSDGKLKTRSLKGDLNPEIISLIKNNKERIIEKITTDQEQFNSVREITGLAKISRVKRKFTPSFGQQRLWFIDKMEGGSSHYNLPYVIDLKGDFDVSVAEQTFNKIIWRHESLRTLIVENNSNPFLVVSDAFDFMITRVDLKGLDQEKQQETLTQLIQQDASSVFDLNKDIMLRVSYVCLTDNHGFLLMNMHHIASDGWSIGILHREFSKLYNSALQKNPLVLEPLEIQYIDYADWQLNSFRETALKQQMDYWLKKLDGMPQLHSLPLDHERPDSATLDGSLFEFELEKGVSDGLKKLSNDQGATVFMIIHAAFVVLLSRYSNSKDIVVGTPVANRSKTELESLVGFFVNTLVLRVDCSGNASFIDFLQHIKEVNINALSHQDVPFEHLVEQLNPERNTRYNTLFQIMFMMDANSIQSIKIDGVVVEQIKNKNIPAKFDLTLDVTSGLNEFKCTFLYKKNLFDESTIIRLSDGLKLIINGLIKEPSTCISELSILTQNEENYLKIQLNKTDITFPSTSCVHQLFEAQVVKTPNNPALIFEDTQLSYLEFNQKSNQLAHQLITLGIKPDDFVGLFFERSIEMMTAIFAVMKAGAAYLPLDPGLPEDRVSNMIVDSGAEIVLTSSLLQNKVSDSHFQIIAIDNKKTTDRLDKFSNQNPVITGLTPTHAAYMIYTSGSTGNPKGVIVEHISVVNYIYSIDHYLDDSDGAIFVTNYSFDGTVTVLLPPLTKGQYLKIIPENDDKFQALANDLSSDQQNYLFKLTPSYIDATRLLVKANQNARHTLILGGETLYGETYQFWSNLFPKTVILNHYGPTEATVGCSTFYIGKKRSLTYPKGIPIGKPLANNQFYILDESLHLVPFGSVGELYIGGLGLARGYNNQIKLTQERFIPNPFSDEAESRLYRTGDLVRYLSDGNVDFLGRTDFQVKIRGLRIELGEIENRLCDLDCVEQCLVMLCESKSDDKHLLAYITTQSILNQEQLINSVKSQLQKTLPVYMVPSLFIVLDEMPLNSSGKIARKSLPSPDTQSLRGGIENFEAPKSDTEHKLIEIWSDLLKTAVQNISRKANFFELGGHSLLSVRLVAEVRAIFSVELAIRDVFDYPLISTFAKVIETGNTVLLEELTAYKRTSNQIACSYAQQRLWFIDQMDGASSHYNMPAVMQVIGNLCLKTAEKAFIRVINRHEPLRTVFVESDSGPQQIIQDHFKFTITRINLVGVDAEEQQQKVIKFAQEDASKPFDLSADVMLRISYIALTDDEGVMLFNMHHIASDGWSVGVFVKEFSLQYCAILEGKKDPLLPLRIQYADYAQWQRKWLVGDVLEKQLQYWETQLADLPTLHQLQLDKERLLYQSHHGQGYDFKMDFKTLTGLKQLAIKQNSTLFMVIHAAFSLLLARYSNSNDIVVGTPVANRRQKDLEPLIGFFVNTLVLRVDCSNNPLFKDFLQQVKQVNLDAQANQDVPFEFLVDRLSPIRSTAHNALFQIMFSMDNNDDKELILPEVKLTPGVTANELDQVKAKFDLLLNSFESDQGLICSFVYNTDLFNLQTIERLSKGLMRLLSSMVYKPERSLSELPLISAQERNYLLETLNQTQSDYPSSMGVHQLFEDQVKRTPDEIALTFKGKELSYIELNEKANQLAHYLIEKGVSPDDFVGLHFDRSLEMLVALFAVLKAGAAYLPLDPGYPLERINYMVSDCQPKLLLTQQHLLALISDSLVDSISIDCFEFQNLMARNPTENPLIKGFTSRNLAYVIYTSGSTGLPKGALVEHRSVTNLATNLKKMELHQHKQSWGWIAPLSFDASLQGICMLVNGQKLTLISEQDKVDPHAMRSLLEANVIGCIDCTPTLLDLWLQMGLEPILPDLVIGGESINEALWTRLVGFQNIYDRKAYNVYGPTECCVDSSIALIQNSKPVIGKPMANFRFYILDENQNLLPMGAVGELYIAGPGVARGYINQPDLTAERFILNPFTKADNEIMYRTGDLVSYLSDGNLQFIGRTDDQVKIRGYRVELGEIERQLLDCPDVSSAVVVIDQNEGVGKRLIAYICNDNGCDLNQVVTNVRHYLESRIPNFMMPTLFMVLQDIPITGNGKVDKSALPKPNAEDLLSDYSAPEGAIENTLCSIWSEVLQLSFESISTQSNFFELGGDSILSIQVVSRATAAGLKVTVKQLFEYQTIQNLSSHIKLINEVQRSNENVLGEMLLLPIQKRFFSSPIEVDHYNQTVLLHTPSDFNHSLLKLIVEHLYKRHDALRLRFVQKDGGAWRAEHTVLSASMIEESLGKIVLDETDFENLSVQAESLQKSLSISQGPLFRAAYCTNNDGVGRLLIIIHHLVVDGVSWRIIMDDIECLYNQYKANEDLSLPPKSASYQSWGAFLSDDKQIKNCLNEHHYWQEVIAHSVPDLPKSKPQEQANLGFGHTDFKLSNKLTSALLSQAPSAYRTQVNELLLSALLLGIYEWSGNQIIRLDLEGHGRQELSSDIDLSQTVGWFTSLFPLILSSKSMDLPSLICSVKEACRTIPNKGVGYGVLKYLKQEKSFQNNNNSPILFNYLGQVSKQSDKAKNFPIAAENTGQSSSPERQAEHGLTFNGIVLYGELSFRLNYDRSSFADNDATGLLECFESALKEVISHCSQPNIGQLTPSDFPLTSLNQQQLDDWQHLYAIEDIYPATAMQQGLFYHSALKDSAYVTQLMFTLEQDTNLKAFKSAWEKVINRHAVLKTAFVSTMEGELYQLVHHQVSLPWSECDLKDLDETVQLNEIEKYRQADKIKGFIIDQAPLLRIQVWHLGKGRYRILFSNHHALLDGWSTPLVFADLFRYYRAEIINQPLILNPPVPYRHYLKWISEQNDQQAKEFWQLELMGVEGPTAVLGPHISIEKTLLIEHVITFNQSQSKQLQKLASSCQVTLNNLLQAAWAYLLSRYTNQKTVVFGVTVSGRPATLPDVENMVGLFINTIPVRVDVAYDLSVKDWFKQLHCEQMVRDEYSYLPLVEIQRQSSCDDNLITDNLFVFENYPLDDNQFNSNQPGQLNVSQTVGYEDTDYSLSITAALKDKLTLKLLGQHNGFTEDFLQQLGRHLTQIIEGMIADVQQPVHQLPLLSKEDEHNLMYTLNDSKPVVTSELGVHQLFEQQVKRTPNKRALVFEGQSLSYQKLNHHANKLAHSLLEQGVKADQLIGICLERSLDMIVAILAVLKAGGAYVPLDPSYAQARIKYIIEDSGLKLLITAKKLKPENEKGYLTVLILDDETFIDELKLHSVNNPLLDSLRQNHLAYVIYTSGSTGQPKGVLIEHQGVSQHIKTIINELAFASEDQFLQFTSMSFDAFVEQTFGSLVVGGTLHIRGEELWSVEHFYAYTQKQGITVTDLPPVYLAELLSQGQAAKSYWATTPLTCVVVGGETLSKGLVERWFGLNSDNSCQLYNAYGPTETTITSHLTEILNIDSEIPIGAALPGRTSYILDQFQKLIPDGQIGELFIGGAGLARGYLNQPELTQKQFINHMFSDGRTERLYRTGDLVRHLGQGKLAFVGRIDNQIKIRGFRVELGEIEHVLSAYPAIKNCVVVLHEKLTNQKSLCAYYEVSKNSDEIISVEQLKASMRASLPQYMIPSVFVELDAMPINVNGKIDRHSLPAPDESGLSTKFVPPDGSIELDLASIWADILNLPEHQISAEANFFELGGHSLHAVKLLAKIKNTFAVNLKINALFESTSLSILAKHLSMLTESDGADQDQPGMEHFEI